MNTFQDNFNKNYKAVAHGKLYTERKNYPKTLKTSTYGAENVGIIFVVVC